MSIKCKECGHDVSPEAAACPSCGGQQPPHPAGAKPKYRLADLMAEMPEGLPRVEGWDEMPVIGKEM